MLRNLAIAVCVCLASYGYGFAEESKGEEGTVPDENESAALYELQRVSMPPALEEEWDSPAWREVESLAVDHFYPPSTFEPKCAAKAAYDAGHLYIHFRVEDRYIRTVTTEYHGPVWKDACAEFFVQPKAGRGYFNFEINSGGTMLLSYHENPEYKGETKEGSVPWELASQVAIHHSLPKTVEPEIAEETTWFLSYRIPISLLETYVGEIGDPRGQAWRANFYKCAELNSHPHWASWSLIKGKLDFHQPEFFGTIRFAG